MKTRQLTALALLLAAFSACGRGERQNKRDTDDHFRTGEPPKAENLQPMVAPNATDPSNPGKHMDGTPEERPLAKPDRDAEGDFKAAQGQKISGEAELKEVPNGVQVSVEVKEAPTGVKALHIHEKGDCSNMEAKSMGEHFAPKGQRHGLPGPAEHHLGDLGNITIGKDGTGRLETVVPGANLKGNDAMSFRGKAIVIQAGKDTGAEPDGAAGKPLACAVIEG